MAPAMTTQTRPTPANPDASTMRALLVAALLSGTFLLTGCAPITSVQPGTPAKDVVSKYGKPKVVCPQSDGSTRLVWTSQPAGEAAWATKMTIDKRVSGFQQVLNNAHFDVLNSGTWTAEMVRCEFGPPAEVESYPSGRNRGTVWSYHYMSPSGLFKLFNVNFGEDGQTVRSFDTDVDPERDPSMFGFSN